MADSVTKVERYSVDVPNKPGEGACVLGALAEGKVNLLAAWGYPLGSSGTSRIELVASDSSALRTAAKKAKIKLKRESAGFHIAGRDKAGAVSTAMAALAEKGVNVHAIQAVASGSKYGCLIEVDASDVRKAAKALGL